MKRNKIATMALLMCITAAPTFAATGTGTGSSGATSTTGSTMNNTGTSTGTGMTGTTGTGTGTNTNTSANTGMNNQIPNLSSLDINNDGMLSRNEFTANNQLTASQFNRIDTNNDGEISQTELDVFTNANGSMSVTGTSTTTP